MPTLIFTLLPSRDFPIQALLFPNSPSISFFIPPINTVFYLIERLRQYFILRSRKTIQTFLDEPSWLGDMLIRI